jgi:L-threonylcarbamoyladenylate synthase
MIHEESLVAALGKDNPKSQSTKSDLKSPALRSPGQLRKHYSPKAQLVVLAWQDEADLRRQILQLDLAASQSQVIAHSRIPGGEGFAGVSVIPHDAEAFARAIYAELHRCDEAGAKLIVVEALPEAVEWRAIADRLARAAGE